MENPPVPTLPPPAKLRHYVVRPPDFLSPIATYPADEEAAHFTYDACDSSSITEKFALLRQALTIFPFSVDALAYWASIYVYNLKEYEKGQQTYELALEASRLLWPNLEKEELIEWAHIEHRPFLRTCHGLGVVKEYREKMNEAIEMYRFLLKVNPRDNQDVRALLFNALIKTGEYKQAEDVAEKHSDGRKSTSPYFQYGFVLIDYLKFKLGVCSEAELNETLVLALGCNPYVPDMLLGNLSPPPKSAYESSGSTSEAGNVMEKVIGAWKQVPGSLNWLGAQKYLGGKKPSDDGSLLFQLLQNGVILVDIQGNSPFAAPSTTTVSKLTTKVNKIPGTARPEFCLAPGMKEHNPNKIVAFDLKKAWDTDCSFASRYISFPYEHVVAIPFWKAMQNSNGFWKDDEIRICAKCYETASLRCASCQVTWYCGRDCQKKHWKAGHKLMCPKYVKT